MQTITEFWASKKIARKEMVRQEQERLSCETINVAEFDGQLYITCNGIPVVPVSSLNTDIADVIASSRKIYLEWINKTKSNGKRW